MTESWGRSDQEVENLPFLSVLPAVNSLRALRDPKLAPNTVPGDGFFNCWGGEAVERTLSLSSPELGEALKSYGKPAVVVAGIDLPPGTGHSA